MNTDQLPLPDESAPRIDADALPNLPALHVSEMSQDDLDTLMNICYGHLDEVGRLPTFDLFWSFFLAHDPSPEDVLGLFEEVEDLGYYVKEEVEHPYAKEWDGSHTGATENGKSFHMTCLKEFAESEQYQELMKVIDKVAKRR